MQEKLIKSQSSVRYHLWCIRNTLAEVEFIDELNCSPSLKYNLMLKVLTDTNMDEWHVRIPSQSKNLIEPEELWEDLKHRVYLTIVRLEEILS